MTPNSPSCDLTAVTVKQAAAALACRALAVRGGSPTVEKVAFEKAAEGFLGALAGKYAPGALKTVSDGVTGAANKVGLGGALASTKGIWDSLGSTAQSGIQGGLLGGLGGAALGGLTEDEEGESHPWSGALRGALVGGAMGAGGQAAYNHFSRVGEPATLKIPGKPKGSPLDAVPRGAGGKPGEKPGVLSPETWRSNYRRSGVSVPEGNPDNAALAELTRKKTEFQAANPGQDFEVPGGLGLVPEQSALRDRNGLLNRAIEAGGNAYDAPHSTLPYAAAGVAPGLAYEGQILARRAHAARGSAALQGVFDAAKGDPLKTVGLTPAQAQAMHGASPATRQALQAAMANNGAVSPALLARVPEGERGLLRGVVDRNGSRALAPAASKVQGARVAAGNAVTGTQNAATWVANKVWRNSANPMHAPHAVPPQQPMRPLTAAPRMSMPSGYTPLAATAKPQYGGLTGNNLPGAVAASRAGLRADARKSITGSKGGRALAWGGPLLIAAQQYAQNNSGLNPDEAARLQQIDGLLGN